VRWQAVRVFDYTSKEMKNCIKQTHKQSKTNIVRALDVLNSRGFAIIQRLIEDMVEKATDEIRSDNLGCIQLGHRPNRSATRSRVLFWRKTVAK